MRKLLVVLGFALAALSLAAQAQAQGYSPAAQRVLSQARAAAGGGGWNLLRGWHESGRIGGLPYQAWRDPLRYGMRVETHEPGGVRVEGFNGAGEWQIAPGGQITGGDVRGKISATRTEAFFDSWGFFYPGRFDARGEYRGVRRLGGRQFDVVEVKPWGAHPRDLWFDRRTHLLGRMVDRSGPKPLVVAVSDYRKVGPVRVAFRFTVENGPDARRQERQIDSLVFTPADRTQFSLPRSTASSDLPTDG